MALGSQNVGDLFREGAHNLAELFSHTTFSWKSIAKFPFYNNIFAFDLIAHLDDFILFGGAYQEFFLDKQLNTLRDTIFEISLTSKYTSKSGQWTKLGRLQLKRVGHSVIEINKKYLVMGGSRDKSTEICELNDVRIICSLRKPVLNNFLYSALTIVYSDTAKNC